MPIINSIYTDQKYLIPYTYVNNVNDMKKNINVNQLIITLGYNTPNDGGGGVYLVKQKADDDENNLINIVNGNITYELQYTNFVHMKQMGATTNSDIYLKLKYLIDNDIYAIIDDIYTCSQSITIDSHYILKGISSRDSKIIFSNVNGLNVIGYYNRIEHLKIENTKMNPNTVGINQNYTVKDGIYDCENIYDDIEVNKFDTAIYLNNTSRSCIFNKIKTTSVNGTYGINCVGTDNFFTDCIISFNKNGLTLYNNNHAENIKCFYSSHNAIQLTGDGNVLNNAIIQQFNNGCYIVGNNNVISSLKGNYVGYGGNGNFIANSGASNIIEGSINNNEYESESGILSFIYTNIGYAKTNNQVKITTTNKSTTQDIPSIDTIGYSYLKNNIIIIDNINYQTKPYLIGDITNNLFINENFERIEIIATYVISGSGNYKISSIHDIVNTFRILNSFYQSASIFGYKGFAFISTTNGFQLRETDTSTTYNSGKVYGYLV